VFFLEGLKIMSLRLVSSNERPERKQESEFDLGFVVLALIAAGGCFVAGWKVGVWLGIWSSH
jgi:hypothetical protein